MLRIIEKYVKNIERNRNYPSYWEEENATQRFFDEYMAFIYNHPNSNTAKKLLKLFEKEGIHFLEKLKIEMLNNKNQTEFIKNWIDEEDINLFLKSKE
jgi:thioredoxin-related protein